ncbi:hypothetical protein HK413_06305 [Mucilaginibacter sp. S1162]|uniref:Uncharacterized protein n=1 Tax=Mucilaginibacter humi TaxID=2732510 RepID=A0ABX1W6B1_9SPHI|nr:hypothetical protein [Mucilaginibacter humi]NNU33855.1 hypothetical protein [Mucilaginibacter humi]
MFGVTMRTFGSPYNASDSVTNSVIKEQGDIKVFLFGSFKTDEIPG